LNFGLLPIFVIALCVVLLRKKGDVGQGRGGFRACCISSCVVSLKFAPWEWDNTKIMVWSYNRDSAQPLDALDRPMAGMARALAGCRAILSGFVSTWAASINRIKGMKLPPVPS